MEVQSTGKLKVHYTDAQTISLSILSWTFIERPANFDLMNPSSLHPKQPLLYMH